jgi:hypothetical protein
VGFPARLLPTSLRARLALAFLALVSLILFVGAASYSINQQVRTRVAELRSSDLIDLRHVDLDQVGLEFEGFWNPSGSFVATDIEVLAGVTLTRLRGLIQAVDLDAHTFTVYGVPIHVTEDAELELDDEPLPMEVLHVGQRVEVSCEIQDGRWLAHRVYLKAVKSSEGLRYLAGVPERIRRVIGDEIIARGGFFTHTYVSPLAHCEPLS